MQRILRLSLANIKKHKMQSLMLALLIMCCMMISGAAISSKMSIQNLYPDVMKEHGIHNNGFIIREKSFNDGIIEILSEDDRVRNITHMEILFSLNANYLGNDGEEKSLYMGFVTQDMEKEIERSSIDSTLSDEEIAAIEHPIYMPYAAKMHMDIKEGDSYDVVYGTRCFSFTVAGFYESLFMSDTNRGFKFIVSDKDYITLCGVMDKFEFVLYDTDEDADSRDVGNNFTRKVDELSGRDVSQDIWPYTYAASVSYVESISENLIYIMVLIAVIIMVTSAVMIRFRISGDIKDQIQSIGVLEALGYTSKQITLSYTFEYILIALVGIIIGGAGAAALTPIIYSRGEALAGHHGTMTFYFMPIVLIALGLLVFVSSMAFIRALSVRKYPPVMAFRKGIGTHHFGKNHFPLRKTGKNVHLRLAMKGFVSSMGHSAGIFVCICISAIAVAVSLILSDTFGSRVNVAMSATGAELCDIYVTVADTADAKELAESISHMEGVRKATPCSSVFRETVFYAYDHTEELPMLVYEDFSDTECIKQTSGRLPEHDNEVSISKMFAVKHGLEVGNDLTLEKDGVQKNYIISGITIGVTNGGTNVCIMESGVKRLVPTYRAPAIDVFLEEGVDTKEFKAELLRTYGRSISDMRKDDAEGGTLEEKVQAVADQKMAELINSHGATHVEYAVKIGDKMITGSSGGFNIKSVSNLREILFTQIGGMFDTIALAAKAAIVVTALVVMIIISMLMEQTVRKQRRDLGIMMGMGYTTNELMLQLAFRIMPAAIAAVIIGMFSGSFITQALFKHYIGMTMINLPLMICAVAVMIVFCFGCAYLGARKIKKISVTELMTE